MDQPVPITGRQITNIRVGVKILGISGKNATFSDWSG